MRKYLLAIIALVLSLTVNAQDSKQYRMTVHHTSGETTTYEVSDVDYIDFQEIVVEKKSVKLTLVSTTENSITVNADMPADCYGFTLAVVPTADIDPAAKLDTYVNNVKYQVGIFSSSLTNKEITGLQPGTAYAVLAQATDAEGLPTEVSRLDATTSKAQVAPKVGDYYYSDGTWSDGGLVSIDADGTNPVWSATKPQPEAGKTVIGIVCQTNSDRIAAADKADGYTHGYVLACKNAGEPGRDGGTTRWVNSFDYEGTKVQRLASTWYANLNGRANTAAALQAATDAKAQPADYCPAFYYSSTGFGVEAPASSSGWFLPSTGQLWDALANFLGNETATIMKGWQTLDYDASFYANGNPAGDNPLDRFNAIFSNVPAAQKDVLNVISSGRGYTSLWSSDRYDTESACQFNFGVDGSKNMIEGMIDWYNGDAYARPMLAF